MDLFGSDSDSDSSSPSTSLRKLPPPPSPNFLPLSTHILQRWSTHNRLPYTPHVSQPVLTRIKNVPLSEYAIRIEGDQGGALCGLRKLLEGKGLKIVEDTTTPVDYIINVLPDSPLDSSITEHTASLNPESISIENEIKNDISTSHPSLVPGGQLLTVSPTSSPPSIPESFTTSSTPNFLIQINPGFKINTQSCKWLPNSSKISQLEWSNVESSTVCMSAYEIMLNRTMCTSNILRVSESIRLNGFVVIPGLFEEELIGELSERIMEDYGVCRERILERLKVDLEDPKDDQPTVSFKELSMREDFRVDIRNTPNLIALKTQPSYTRFRSNPTVLEIIKTVMAGKRTTEDYLGNYGKYNFSVSSSPSSPPRPPNIGDLGSVISLPGCADQAIHADTPHIFDFQVPAHYVNLFCVGKNLEESVGQTCFVKGSQVLGRCREMEGERRELERNVVRPFVKLGDAVMFDCR
ncbi:hypothetical protein TL16_g01179 [Triparma laevis f. inornata]|nr:hypothetical protein TL16_g01179 [Triparma laevis f. inornata]